MPEMTFTVQWADGAVQRLYSPSLVVHDYLEPGADYSVDEFMRRTSEAMRLASERVEARFGFPCSRARATRQQVVATASTHEPDSCVRVLAMEPPA